MVTNIYRSTPYTSILTHVSLDLLSEITNGRAYYIRLLLEYYYPHTTVAAVLCHQTEVDKRGDTSESMFAKYHL